MKENRQRETVFHNSKIKTKINCVCQLILFAFVVVIIWVYFVLVKEYNKIKDENIKRYNEFACVSEKIKEGKNKVLELKAELKNLSEITKSLELTAASLYEKTAYLLNQNKELSAYLNDITENNEILGGYTNNNWDISKSSLKYDKSAFLFNLIGRKVFKIRKSFEAIYTGSMSIGPAFGIGDLIVSGNVCKSDGLATYEDDNSVGYEEKDDEEGGRNLLGMRRNPCKIVDYEVYTVFF